tara:strand:+ start:1803 stop:1931 length:129 start_codon:yes stop_codon:yes gene_type:complete
MAEGIFALAGVLIGAFLVVVFDSANIRLILRENAREEEQHHA